MNRADDPRPLGPKIVKWVIVAFIALWVFIAMVAWSVWVNNPPPPTPAPGHQPPAGGKDVPKPDNPKRGGCAEGHQLFLP